MIVDRLTIDIDYYEPNAEMRALRAYHGLRRLDIVDNIEVHVSTSGKGIHIEGHLSERLSDDERYALRRGFCDDTKRVDLDEERGAVGHATDIFWTEKAGNDGERQQVDDIWAALDWLERGRSDASRVEQAAKHGRKGVWATTGFNRASLAEMTDKRNDRWDTTGGTDE